MSYAEMSRKGHTSNTRLAKLQAHLYITDQAWQMILCGLKRRRCAIMLTGICTEEDLVNLWHQKLTESCENQSLLETMVARKKNKITGDMIQNMNKIAKRSG